MVSDHSIHAQLTIHNLPENATTYNYHSTNL